MSSNFKDFLIKKINTYREVDKHYETDVTAIVNLLLEICDIRGLYGYIIKDESVIISVRKSIIPIESSNLKSDKLVFKESERPIRGNLRIDDEKPLLVIECKSHNDMDDDFKEDDIHQIVTYMTALKFPYGVLISQYKAYFYKRKYNKGLSNIVPFDNIDDIRMEIDKLMEVIKFCCQ